MNRLNTILAALLLVLALAHSTSLCANCYDSQITIDKSRYSQYSPVVVIKASYVNLTHKYPTPSGEKVSMNLDAATITNMDLVPAKNALLQISFDGQPILDKNAKEICRGDDAITDENGLFSCTVEYAKNPNGSSTPLAISSWPYPGLLTVELLRSYDEPRMKYSTQSIILYPKDHSSEHLYPIFLRSVTRPEALSICLPVAMVLGLLIASMYYHGKNPLSLLDITVPRLPSAKKVRMRSATVPVHLSSKGRLVSKIKNRIDKSAVATIAGLYKSKKKVIPDKKQIKSLMAKGGKDLSSSTSRLVQMVNDSEADDKKKKIAIARLKRLKEVNEALDIDKAATTRARTGGFSVRKQDGSSAGSRTALGQKMTKVAPNFDWLGQRLARPWKFIPAVARSEKADIVPGIPYIERASIVAQNWWNGRLGNIGMRRGIYRTLLAESGASLGLLSRDSRFARENMYDFKKIGELPHIVERLRYETFLLGRAISDEQLRNIFLNHILLKKSSSKNGDEYTIDKRRMLEVLRLKQNVEKEIDRLIASKPAEYSKALRQYHINIRLAEHLKLYIEKNHIKIYDAYGQALTKEEADHMMSRAIVYLERIRQIMREDGQLNERGGFIKDGEEVSRMHPDDVYSRYKKMTGMIKEFDSDLDYLKKLRKADTRHSPFLFVGRDIADVYGEVVLNLQSKGKLDIPNEGVFLLHIRHMIEAEMMKKSLFDTVMSERALSDKYGRDVGAVMLGDGRLNPKWFDALKDNLSLANIRQPYDYAQRSEWAARNHLTAYNTISSTFIWETERNKIEMLRRNFAAQFDGSYENFFKNYKHTIERNKTIYESMKALAPFYLDSQWDADTYNKWKERGVTYGDVRKGIWLIGAERTIFPLASGFKRDEEHNVIDAYVKADKNGLLKYDSSIFSMMLSEYAERPINTSLLFKQDDGKWKPGVPSEIETNQMIGQFRNYWNQLLRSKYITSHQTLDKDERDAEASSRLNDKAVLANIKRIEKMLDEKMKFIPRSALADDPSQTALTRMSNRVTNFAERVARGGVHELDERLHEWFTSQSYARIVLESFNRDWENKRLMSDEVRQSFDLKERIRQDRMEMQDLMLHGKLSPEQQDRLSRLRSDVSLNISQMHNAEAKAREASKYFGDRETRGVANMFTPTFNVFEQTVMRDPRITFGSAYGMGPALMSGYQSGQFVGERPSMWAGYGLMPGDKAASTLSWIPYWTSMAYASHTRTFFTKITGYTTVYHQDPEHPDLNRSHELEVMPAFQSLFRPAQNFDWFTRFFPRPIVRGLNDYRDEFGWKFTEEHKGAGPRPILPLSWKAAGADATFDVDEQKYRLMGFDANSEIRRRKLGLTFREEMDLWYKRYSTEAYSNAEETNRILKTHLENASSPSERQMIKSVMKEVDDAAKTTRSIWSIPVIGNYFKQGYYALENRAGYDVSAAGAAHRLPEFIPWEKNMSGYITPGMYYPDFEGHWQMYPRISRTFMNPVDNMSALSRHANIRPQDSSLKGDDYLLNSGVGRDLHLDAIKDVYKRETSLLWQMVDVERQRHAFSFLNTPYILPMAPLYIGIYQAVKKSTSWGRNNAWSEGMQKQKDLGPMTPEQQANEANMRNLADQARIGKTTYNCPTHGIELPGGSLCPLCRTQEQVDQEKHYHPLKERARRSYQNIKNMALSTLSLGGDIPIGNYNHYQNMAHCPTHGIGYQRGTMCPLCTSDVVHEHPQISKDMVNENKKMLDHYRSEINKVTNSIGLSESEKIDQISSLVDERDKYWKEQPMSNLATYDLRIDWKSNLHLIKDQLKKISEYDKKGGYKIK